MPNTVQQSAPKWELMLALELESTNQLHRTLYALMKVAEPLGTCLFLSV